MQSSQWTVFLAICLQGPLPLGCLADRGRGIPWVSVIIRENARLETSYLGPSTESFDGPTYYPAYFPCVLRQPSELGKLNITEEALVLPTIPSLTGRGGLVLLLVWGPVYAPLAKQRARSALWKQSRENPPVLCAGAWCFLSIPPAPFCRDDVRREVWPESCCFLVFLGSGKGLSIQG